MRSQHEGSRDLARAIATTDAYLVSHRERKKVEILFAHLKRILRLDRLPLRGPYGAKDEFHLAAAAQSHGTFERADFTFERENDRYICPGGKVLSKTCQAASDPGAPSSLRPSTGTRVASS